MASGKVHGITIDLDVNASGVSKAFNDINKDIRAASAELKSVDKLLKLNPNSVVLLTQKQNLLTDAIDKTEDKLVQLAKAKQIADSDTGIDKNSKAYRELERDIINARNSLEKFNKEAEANNTALQNASREGNELGKSIKDSSESALTFGNIVKGNIVSSAIIGGVKLLTSAFKEVGSAIADTVLEAVDYTGEIKALSKQYNLSMQELQLYTKATKVLDTDVSTITGAYAKLTKSMTSSSKSVQNAYKQLGIATKDGNGQLRDSNEVFNEIISALGQIEDETLQDSYAMEIFGKSASSLGSLINGGTEDLAKFNEYLKENNLLLSDEEIETIDKIGDALDYAEATIEGIKEKLVLELAPVIAPIIDEINQFVLDNKDKIVEIVDKILEWQKSEEAQEFFGLVKDLVDDVIELIKNVATLIDDVGILDGAWNFVKETIKAISDIIDHINDIITGDAWRNGTLFSGGWNDMSEFSGGVPSNPNLPYSGGFGNVTLNANFNITNGNNIDKRTVMQWADQMTDRISENLGSSLRVRG